jgi:Flp pilus assembly protein TadD
MIPAAYRDAVKNATAEYEKSITVRPDDAFALTNLGSYRMDKGNMRGAVEAFEKATKLRPDIIQPLVNSSLAYDQLGRLDLAEEVLRKALRLEPACAPANMNLGLLLANQGRKKEAETRLRNALKADPRLAAAAYNLAVLVSGRDPDEAVAFARKAAANRPSEPKYSYTVAFYLLQSGRQAEAEKELLSLMKKHPNYLDAYEMLGTVYAERGALSEAETIYREGIKRGQESGGDTRGLEQLIRRLHSRSR